jgi:hemerythrin-like domain-containing protein
VKRAEALRALSREHHVALELALRLRRATDADADAVAAAAADFWHTAAREHFRDEEEILLPAFARHVAADDPDIVRVLVEHVELRRRFASVAAGAEADRAGTNRAGVPRARVGAADLNALGELLAGHVRHEERTLFPRIEAALDDGELSAVSDALATG